MKQRLLTLALILLATTSFAAPVTDAEKTQTIDALFASMTKTYVFPDKAAEAEKSIRAHLANGDYASIVEGREFATRLTEDLRAVCHDAHLHVRYDEHALPPRKQADKPSPDEISQEKRLGQLYNGGFLQVQRLEGNVGYIKFDGFMDPKAAERPLRAAMDFVSDTDALIFDVRENGGGDPATVRLVCSYLFDSKPVHLNDIYMRPTNHTDEFWTLAKLPGKRYLGKEVYVLTSKRTGSGAEEFAYDLKNLHRATIVGESTWGGANPGDFVRLNDHFGAFVPNGRAINPYTKTNWEGTGVDPDVHVTAGDALKTAHLLAVKKLAAKTEGPEKNWREQAVKQLETRP